MAAYPRTRIGLYAVITVIALTTDLLSKGIVFSRLGGVFQGTGWLIDSWVKFELHTSLNPGALWGMGQGFAPVFAALSVVAFAGINYWLFFRGAAASLWLTIALAMVSGGALGNCYDRLGWHGEHFPNDAKPALAVRDFLRFRFGNYDYPIFNIADSFLVAGAIMLMIQSLKQEDDPASTDLKQSPAA
ncbi:MAG: signal peptidase II [Planctomycetota bacterium]|nr:MAG: signal peptidase II [Planctomycetota bacterium]